MKAPSKPANEALRIDTLRALHLLDTDPEERFDRITRLARRLFDVPVALVSLVDKQRQWFKSHQGLETRETPRDVSFCGHAILDDDVFVIEDAFKDPRFSENPLVIGAPGIRFYAGYPLTVPNGSNLGTLCIIDYEPRIFAEEDMALLRDLGHMAEQEVAGLYLATMDELTNLSNRRGFTMLGGHTLGMCRRLNEDASLLYFDLDRFKQINDRFGHAEGDQALRCFAMLLRETFRESDVIGRLGGDEFAILLTGASAREVSTVLERLQQAVDEANGEGHCGYKLAYSVGDVAFDPDQHGDIDALIGEADQLMYQRKRAAHKASAKPSP